MTQELEPVAWLHSVRQDSDVITHQVKHLWGRVKQAVGREAQYTIPLYSAAQLQQVRDEIQAEIDRKMSVRGFDQVKEDWMSNYGWQFADRDACWKFFYEAGKAAGKAVPMKYKRMAFNAELQKQLTAAQAHIEKLWGALSGQLSLEESSLRLEDEDLCYETRKSLEALAIKSSTDALREHDAKLVKAERYRIADYLDTLYVLENAADKIRKGEFIL